MTEHLQCWIGIRLKNVINIVHENYGHEKCIWMRSWRKLYQRRGPPKTNGACLLQWRGIGCIGEACSTQQHRPPQVTREGVLDTEEKEALPAVSMLRLKEEGAFLKTKKEVASKLCRHGVPVKNGGWRSYF